MTLSTSRQQFLAYETHAPEEIHYGRKGGMFISTLTCVVFILLAVVAMAIVGVIVYFITFFKVSQQNSKDFWDDKDPFAQVGPPSPDLRLPTSVAPSFYRLKLKADLDNSSFSGDVYITIRANKKVKEIILHAKDLNIHSNIKLTEQIYEKVDTSPKRRKRDTSEKSGKPEENKPENANNTTLSGGESNQIVREQNDSIASNVTNTNLNITSNGITETNITTDKANVTEVFLSEKNETEAPSTNNPVEPPKMTTVETQVTHSSVRNIEIIKVKIDTGDRLILTLASALKPDVDYTLEISFNGSITNALTGFYKSTYLNKAKETKSIGVTQFEPTSARAAFPCFDEPALKAKFEISIAHPNNISVLSNMRVSSQENIVDQPAWVWTHFERSVKMSTYLVAYILSDFKSLETSYLTKDNITKSIKVWTRPELISKAQYALTITPKLLSYYEDVFGVPYALDKIDLVAIPDFSSGAMENWGLVTFRETALLFDEQTSVPRDKQNVAIDVAHELAHQWFGNLVTMKWWTDLWLNEGFATYIEYLGVNRIHPEWNMLESLTRDKMDLLVIDALKTISPVSREVDDASEISQKFDEISYTKGANLIRMLNHTLSEKIFQKGLLIYLNDWKYANAEENDLWEAMSKATKDDPAFRDLSIVDFMNTWTKQAGYPVVNVNRNYQTGDVRFEQKLFTSAQELSKDMKERLWHIPISYTRMLTNQWSSKPKLWLKGKSETIQLPYNASEALYINVDAIGYYRVNYDQKNWELLAKALKSGQVHSPITKAQLIDDAFNLAKMSQLNYSYALGLTTCVINGEDSRVVWDLLFNSFGFLKHNLKTTSGYVYFMDYVKILLAKQLERLNYGLKKPKNDIEAFLIENLVMWECYVESPRCLNWARTEFEKLMNTSDINNNPIPTYLRSLVYNMALKHGGRREFDFLWDAFINTSDPNVKSLIVNNLASTREESLITMLLEKSLTDIPKQYAVAVWAVESPIGTRIAQRFLIENFDRVYNAFTKLDMFMFPAVLNGAFGVINTDDELDKLKSFAIQHKNQLMPMSQTLQKLVDTATFRIDWLKKHAAEINRWFKDFVTGNMTSEDNNTVPNGSTSNNTVPNITSNKIEPNVTTTNNMKPNVTTSNNMEPNVTTSNNMEPNVTTSNNMEPNVTASNNMTSATGSVISSAATVTNATKDSS